MDIAAGLIGAAWLAIAGMLLWGAGNGLRRLFRTASPVPFFGMLQRHGLTLTQVEEAVGLDEVGQAVRRCAECAGRWECGRRALDCPNEWLFRRAKGLVEASP